MKALVLSTVFPNPRQPLHGLFVRERVRHLVRDAEVRVIAPVPWFARGTPVPGAERQGELDVRHPTIFYVPGLFKVLDGLFLFLSSVREVTRVRRTFDFDLIDGHFTFPEGVAAILLGRWFHRPVVITMRGSELVFVRHMLRRAAIGWAVRHASRVIAVSADLAALARELGTPADRIDVIPNGVDTVRFSPEPQVAARRALSLPQDRRLVVSIGHLVPLKGFHRIVEAFRGLLREFPDALLAIVGGPGAGSGRYPEQLAKLVRRSRLTNSVLLVGSQPHDRVATWLNAADVLVLDSDREGCPNVVCEALACGCPIVAPKVGEVEHMVPSEAGILFERPEDVGELRRCLAAALNREWNRAIIRTFAERNTWSGVAERVLEAWGAAAPHHRDSAIAKVEITRLL